MTIHVKKFSYSITIEVKEIPIKTFKEEEIYYIDEDIYNFYFNNCALPANYVFCPSNKTNWIKQIIK